MQTLIKMNTPKQSGTSAGAICLRLTHTSHHPFVTHWQNRELGGFCHGNYHETFEQAFSEWLERCTEWLERHGETLCDLDPELQSNLVRYLAGFEKQLDPRTVITIEATKERNLCDGTGD